MKTSLFRIFMYFMMFIYIHAKINITAAISWPPPLILQLFTQTFEGRTLLMQLGRFAWISLYFKYIPHILALRFVFTQIIVLPVYRCSEDDVRQISALSTSTEKPLTNPIPKPIYIDIILCLLVHG